MDTFGSSEAVRNDFSCQFCSKKFGLQSVLDAHLKTKHPFRSSAKLHGTAVSLDAFLGEFEFFNEFAFYGSEYADQLFPIYCFHFRNYIYSQLIDRRWSILLKTCALEQYHL